MLHRLASARAPGLLPTRAPAPRRPVAASAGARAALRSAAPRLAAPCRPAPGTAARRLPSIVASASAGAPSSDLAKTATLGGLFGAWYLFNIWFNIYNKQVLAVFPYPLTCTCLQFGVGSLLALVMWGVGAHPKPKMDKALVASIAPLAGVHTLGNLLTNVSLGAVAVSFTHTIKAMEPFFSVVLSAAFLNDKPSLPVLLTLLPIVGGVVLASASEATFNWAGFGAAMGSNATFQSRNVLSKKFMASSGSAKPGGGLDNINLFSLITMLSFVLLAPVTLAVEGVRLTPAALAASGVSGAAATLLLQRALAAAVCFHAYQQVSYMILQRVSPVTHSVGNCVKRVVVIAASVVFFKNPVTPASIAGTAVALGGVFAYSQVKRAQGKKAA